MEKFKKICNVLIILGCITAFIGFFILMYYDGEVKWPLFTGGIMFIVGGYCKYIVCVED